MTSPNNVPASLCDSARDLLPAYAAGIADAEERALVEHALIDCPELAEDLAAYTELSEAMLFSAAPAAAPAHLRTKILAAIAPAAAAAPALPVPLEKQPDVITRWLAALFRPTMQLRPALAFAAVAIFILTNIFWWAQLQQAQARRQSGLNPQGNLLNFLGTGEITHVNINTQADVTTAWLIYSRGAAQDTWIGLFSVKDLPPLENGTYQGWLIRENEDPVSIGVFDIGEDGTGFLIFEVDEPIGSYDLLGITAEPEGGSPAPTTDPVLAGQL